MCVCLRTHACLRVWVTHENTHLSVWLYNKAISRSRESVAHAQTQLALWKLNKGWSKWKGGTAGVEEWGESMMCNLTYTHTQTSYCAGGGVLLHCGTRRCCSWLHPVGPGKVVRHHSGRTRHLHWCCCQKQFPSYITGAGVGPLLRKAMHHSHFLKRKFNSSD